ncbi:hypothetical protein MMC31_004367 [Peltigera leucophlebia]|nr:hypothetical protein [Peltigera leucophlebia]
MALIRSIKHGKGKLAGYLKQAKKLFHGSPDGDRKSKLTSEKAKVPREIPEAPVNVVSKPATTAATAGAHVGDTEVVLDEEYDYDYWAWNELPPIPSELPTASAPKLKGQEPTVDKGDETLLELATVGKSIARIFESASDPSPLSTTSASTTTSNTAITAITTDSTPPTSDTPSTYKSRLPLSSSSTSSSSSPFSFPSPPKRFQRSPFFGKKIGLTPRVSRISSVSGALDPEAPAFGSPVSKTSAGLTLVGGSDNEPEGIVPKHGGFETFGAEHGGRPFVVMLEELRTLVGPKSPSYTRSPPFPGLRHQSIEEGYARAFALIRELRGYLERP